MGKTQDDNIIIEIDPAEGATLVSIQDALVLGIEKISASETPEEKDHKNAIFWVRKMLRNVLLDESQANVALGGKPYRKIKE